uniref:Uncharacterized protein n=1 Tax=Panagrolaimus sp. PS1159 TaxID=55785 RepID=A0AC35F3V7_9BILA
MTKTKANKDSENIFIEKMCQKFADIADTIPADQWGFDSEMFELLREKRHEVVNKAVPSKRLKSMSKKDKVKLGRELGPVKCNTVTEIINWIGQTHLSKMGIPKRPQNLMNKNNGIVKKEKDPEVIAKASKEKRQKQKESRKKQGNASKEKIQKKKETVKKVKKVKPAKKKNRGGAPTSSSA